MPGIWDTVFLGKNCQRHQRLGTGGLPATSYFGKAPATTPMAKKKVVAIIIWKNKLCNARTVCILRLFRTVWPHALTYCVDSRAYVLCTRTCVRKTTLYLQKMESCYVLNPIINHKNWRTICPLYFHSRYSGTLNFWVLKLACRWHFLTTCRWLTFRDFVAWKIYCFWLIFSPTVCPNFFIFGS